MASTPLSEKNIIRESTMYDDVYKWTAPDGYIFSSPDGTNYGSIIWAGKTLSKASYVLNPIKNIYDEKNYYNSINNINDNDNSNNG